MGVGEIKARGDGLGRNTRGTGEQDQRLGGRLEIAPYGATEVGIGTRIGTDADAFRHKAARPPGTDAASPGRAHGSAPVSAESR